MYVYAYAYVNVYVCVWGGAYDFPTSTLSCWQGLETVKKRGPTFVPGLCVASGSVLASFGIPGL